MVVRDENDQQGFTLLEVMIAAIVLSIGLLGVFQLHLFSKRSSYASINYSQALTMAADMADRMRLNPANRSLYGLATYGTGAIPLPSITCSVSLCSPTELVQWDQYHWDQMLMGANERIGTNNIGAAKDLTGCVFVSGNNVEIVIAWQGLLDSSDGGERLGNSSNAKSCGAAGQTRRQVVLNTVIVEST